MALCFIRARVVNLPETDMNYSLEVLRVGMCRGRASIWMITINPRDIEMEDISSVFFDMVSGVTNMI